MVGSIPVKQENTADKNMIKGRSGREKVSSALFIFSLPTHDPAYSPKIHQRLKNYKVKV